MSHDWMQAVDQRFAALIQNAVLDPQIPSGGEIVENITAARIMVDEVDRQIQADSDKLEQACRAGQEAGTGVLVTREGWRVIDARVSPFVPANTVYLIDTAAMDAFLKEADNAQLSFDYDVDMAQ